MSANATAGLGDPYWYEWSIGQRYILDLLDATSRVAGVTLQATLAKGLDDVVVRFIDGRRRLIQIKHTRVADTLTFGDLVTADSDAPSLLASLAGAWQEAEREGVCDAWLVTNRAPGKASRTRGVTPVARPALDDFLAWMVPAVAAAASIEAIEVPPSWRAAWQTEWLPQLQGLDADARLTFLRRLRITSELGLPEQAEMLRARLATLLGVTTSTASGFLARLDAALRRWATSERGVREEVVREDVYGALCLIEDTAFGEHDLAPASPFLASRDAIVDRVANALLSRRTPIVFVSGEPGSGKTTVISALANRRQPVVDARFHAFRPTTAENRLLPADAGRTTTSRALWTDLLLQIRALLTGRLAKYTVPIHAGSLKDEELRSHVLRLAAAIARDEDRAFVIAIDGIDHAARSGDATTFLDSLVPPEDVPAGVVMLVGGQPPDGYAAYPFWLAQSPLVARVDLPRLTVSDTRALLVSRQPTLAGADADATAREIWEECEGHTLATVFAIEAASPRDGMPPPEAALRPRRLDAGISGYYERIWRAAASRLPLGASARLAASLCLLPVRATAEGVVAVLGPSVSTRQAADFLRALYPLVVEEVGGFRVFHNDVQVFLRALLAAEPAIYRDCASALADHLLQGTDALARQAAAQNLYGVAHRWREQALLFTPAYVIEGATCGQPLATLTDQAIVAGEALAGLGLDWQLTHSVAAGIRTLEQLRVSLRLLDAEAPRPRRPGPTRLFTRAAERRVSPVSSWSPDTLAAAISDIEELRDAGQCERAAATFERWFAGMRPCAIVAACGDWAGEQHPARTDRDLRDFIERVGALSVDLGHLLPAAEADDDIAVELHYSNGVLGALSATARLRSLAAALRRAVPAFHSDRAALLARLVEARAWRASAVALSSFTPPTGDGIELWLVGASVAALSGSRSLVQRWVHPLLSGPTMLREGLAAYGKEIGVRSEALGVVAWSAFLLAFQSPRRDASAIREEIETLAGQQRLASRGDAVVAQVLHASALLGSLARTSRDGLARALHADADTLRRTFAVLFAAGRSREPGQVPLGFASVARDLVRGLSDCAARYGDLAGTTRQAFLQEATDRLCGPHLETLWRTLDDVGDRAALIGHARSWVGQDGIAWSLAPDERHSAVSRLVPLLEAIGELSLADFARDQLARRIVAYGNHKEYVLRQPVEWFEKLSRHATSAWRAEGTRLLRLSNIASRAGGNRLAWRVKIAVVAAAATQSPEAFAAVIGSSAGIAVDDAVVIHGLSEMLERTTLDRRSLLAIWAFAIGQLAWQRRADRYLLAEIRDALVANAARGGVEKLADTLAAAAAEFACEPDPDTAHPSEDAKPAWDSSVPIAMAMTEACATSNWNAIASLIKRVAEEHPSGSQEALAAVVAALSRRPGAAPWFWEGVTETYEALFPLLGAGNRWDLVRHAATAGRDQAPDRRTAALAENLDDLCRLAAQEDGTDALRAGTQRLLTMHELWANDHDTEIVDGPSDGGRTWPGVVVPLLFELLEFDEQTHVQAALRGLHALLSQEPALCADAILHVRASGGATERRFLFIAPSLAAQPAGAAVREWLAEAMLSERLDVALAAWSALRGAERKLAVTAPALSYVSPDWPRRTRVRRLIVPATAPLFERPPQRVGLLSVAGSSSARILDDLAQACGADVDDLRAEFALSVRDAALSPRPPRLRGSQVRDMLMNLGAEAQLEHLFTLLGTREREGCFSDVPTERLAQALVPFVDPLVFLQTPGPAANAPGWPVDGQLDKLVALGEQAVKHDVALLAQPQPGHHLIAATLRSFSARWDLTVSIDHVAPLTQGATLNGRPSVLNGRASLSLDDPSVLIASNGARDEEWLTRHVGGLLTFADAQLDFFPGQGWRKLGWEPDVCNPLIWMRSGQRVAWFERFAGPPRHIFPSGFIYRQPTLARWVCVDDEWARIVATWGQPNRQVVAELAAADELRWRRVELLRQRPACLRQHKA